MLNYVLQNQLTPQQIVTCAQKGYSGIKNGPALTTAMIQWRNANFNSLPKVPDQPNVPAYTSAMGKQYGMGNYDGFDPCSFLTGLVSAVGVAAAGLYLFEYLKRTGRF